jgi:hypothetical protein
METRNYLKFYAFGLGMISIQNGNKVYTHKETKEVYDFPFIDLSDLKKKQETGIELSDEVESFNHIQLLFTNLKGLEVFEEALARCKKHLLEQENKKNEDEKN